MMTEQTQLEFLLQIKDDLGVTWDELAKLADIAPRALKTYRAPPDSQDYRGMSKPVRKAFAAVVQTSRKVRADVA